MTTLTKKAVSGDLVIYVDSLEAQTREAIIRNHAATAVNILSVLGFPVVAGTNGADFNLEVAGGEANTLGLIIDGPEPLALAAATNSSAARKYQVLLRPPVIVNQNKIAAADGAAVAFTIATIVTALKALGWEVRTEPTKITTQTT